MSYHCPKAPRSFSRIAIRLRAPLRRLDLKRAGKRSCLPFRSPCNGCCLLSLPRNIQHGSIMTERGERHLSHKQRSQVNGTDSSWLAWNQQWPPPLWWHFYFTRRASRIIMQENDEEKARLANVENLIAAVSWQKLVGPKRFCLDRDKWAGAFGPFPTTLSRSCWSRATAPHTRLWRARLSSMSPAASIPAKKQTKQKKQVSAASGWNAFWTSIRQNPGDDLTAFLMKN